MKTPKFYGKAVQNELIEMQSNCQETLKGSKSNKAFILLSLCLSLSLTAALVALNHLIANN